MLKLRSLLKLSNFSAEMLLELMLMEEASARYARFSSPSISFFAQVEHVEVVEVLEVVFLELVLAEI